MVDKKNSKNIVKDYLSEERKEKIKEHLKTRAKIFGDFRDFLREYQILALAIAFIMGAAANSLVKSLVDNIIMPLITPALPKGQWESAVLTMGTIQIKWGLFISELLHFLILAIVVFFIAKFIMREEKVKKK